MRIPIAMHKHKMKFAGGVEMFSLSFFGNKYAWIKFEQGNCLFCIRKKKQSNNQIIIMDYIGIETQRKFYWANNHRT